MWKKATTKTNPLIGSTMTTRAQSTSTDGPPRTESTTNLRNRRYPQLWFNDRAETGTRNHNKNDQKPKAVPTETMDEILSEYSSSIPPEERRTFFSIWKNTLVIGQELSTVSFFLAVQHAELRIERREWQRSQWCDGCSVVTVSLLLLMTLLYVPRNQRFLTRRQRRRSGSVWVHAMWQAVEAYAYSILLRAITDVPEEILSWIRKALLVRVVFCDFFYANGYVRSRLDGSMQQQQQQTRKGLGFMGTRSYGQTLGLWLAAALASSHRTPMVRFGVIALYVLVYSLYPLARHTISCQRGYPYRGKYH